MPSWAKSYFVTGTDDFFSELSDLFDDWNEQNPFMWGPEWASPMEESIRLINWLVTAAFLEAAGDGATDGLRKRLCAGAWVMAAHVRQHYSRHSSANNHTIVEAAGVAVAATVFGEHEWLDEALALLEAEVAHQTYLDGVNKEQALHYQLFVMEAFCLVSHVLRTIGKALPASLVEHLRSMARYTRACSVGSGQVRRVRRRRRGRHSLSRAREALLPGLRSCAGHFGARIGLPLGGGRSLLRDGRLVVRQAETPIRQCSPSYSKRIR